MRRTWTIAFGLASVASCGIVAACRPTPVPVPALSPAPAATDAVPLSTPPPSPSTTVAPTHSPPPTDPPSPTPLPVLRQLTSGGCCVQPFWSPDGSQVWFIDKPGPDAPGGIWGVDLSGGQPHFVTDQLGVHSQDGSLIAYPEGGATYVERQDGQRWTVPNDGRQIVFSPDGTLIAWQASSSAVNFDRRTVHVWVAQLDGSNAREVATLQGGGFSGWFPDSERILVSGNMVDGDDRFLAVLDLESGRRRSILQLPRLRGGSISPAGGWIATLVTFSGDPAVDGIWVASADGALVRRLDAFGAYRWRAEGQLLVVPLDAAAASHRLLQVEVVSEQVHPLTDPAQLHFRIAGGDWSVSPDGRHIAFVSATDRNIWLLALP